MIHTLVRRYCARTQQSPHVVHDVVDLGHIDIALAECLPLVGQVDVVFVCVIDDTASQIGNVAGLCLLYTSPSPRD